MFRSREFEARVEWIYELLDMMDGSDHLSRTESSAAPSGFGEATKRYATCGQCGGRGCALCEMSGRVEYEQRDPYDNSPNGYKPPASSPQPLDERDRAKIRDLQFVTSGVIVELVTVDDMTIPVRDDDRTAVERSVFRQLPNLLALKWLERRLRTAADWIVTGAREREPEAVEWLAKRSLEDNIRRPRLVS